MIVSDEKKVVFVWIPHTAGTSMMKFLEKEVPDEIYEIRETHSTAYELNIEKYSDYTFFCTIRNHWDWVKSCWSYEKRRNFLGEEGEIDIESLNFNDFVEKSLEDSSDKTYSWTDGYFSWTGEKLKYVDCYILMNRDRFIGFDSVIKQLGFDFDKN